MKPKVFSFFLLLLASQLAFSQDAVLLHDNTNVVIDRDMSGYTVSYSYAYIINNEKEAELANFVGQFDSRHKLASFEEELSANGFTRKIKKGDLKRTEYSAELVSDGYTLYTEVIPPTYPAMVSYSYEIDVDDEMMSLPPFRPLEGYNIAAVGVDGVSPSGFTWRMTCPKEFKYKYFVRGGAIRSAESVDGKGSKVLSFHCDSLSAMSGEPYGRTFVERMPVAYVSPDTILYHGTKGSKRTWNELGLWLNSLSEGRQSLPADAIAAIHAAADTCQTAYGKIAALKKLMDSRTHYVSIQLGIGGYQPISAADTWKYGFGDCKGLSNLMKAMLQEMGIDSRLVAINLGSRRFVDELPSLQYMNHMILEVPLEKDTCWLECTSAKIPTGYVHEDIAGHHALEFGPEGGRVVVLPVYPDSANVNTVNTDIRLNPDGSAHVVIDDKGICRFYEHEVGLLSADHDKLVKTVNQNYNLPGSVVNSVSVTDNTMPGSLPSLTLHIDANCRYARLSGRRMFVNVDPEGSVTYPDVSKPRTEDFYVRGGRKSVKTITIHIPDGYKVEAMPMDYAFENEFGSMSLECSSDSDGNLVVRKSLLQKNGTFPKADAEKFAQFFKGATNLGNVRLVLVKK